MKLTQEQYRYFLKDTVRLTIDFGETDQSRGKPAPPIEKPVPDGAVLVDLVPVHDWQGIAKVDMTTAIAERQSIRKFSPDSLTQDEFSYLLWATEGIREAASPSTAFRTVPSAGCRHSFETYVCAMRVAGLAPAIYRYLPVEHQLVLVEAVPDIGPRVAQAALGQPFVGKAAATFEGIYRVRSCGFTDWISTTTYGLCELLRSGLLCCRSTFFRSVVLTKDLIRYINLC